MIAYCRYLRVRFKRPLIILFKARFVQPLVQHLCCGRDGIICDDKYEGRMASPIETEAGLLCFICEDNDYIWP